jgi:hypothetical protein
MKNKLQNIFCIIVFCCVTLLATAQQATLMLNEINPNISSSHDLIELVAVNGGSVNGFTVQQGISSAVTLATLPQVNVSSGDIIVIHLNSLTATGAAPGSETISKNEYAHASYTANYDNAWDFHGGATGLTYSNRVLLVKDSAGTIQDAVPFTNNGGSPAAFPGDVVNIQGQNLWYPPDCGGSPCSYSSTPMVESIAVVWQGASTTANGNTAQRISSIDTDNSADWTISPQPQTWGALNAGQVVAVNEEKNSFKVFIFPNPVTSELRIQNAELKIKEVEIYNSVGEKVFQSPIANVISPISVDVSQLPSGIYFYRITSAEKQIACGKFAVQ